MRVLEFDHDATQSASRKCRERHRISRRRDVGDQLLGRLDPIPRFGGTRLRSAAKPCQLFARKILATFLRDVGLSCPLGAREDPVVVAALVLVDLTVVHLPGARGDGVEEPAVVGDDDERAASRNEVLGKPLHAFDVEVVGRLVEDQDVGVGDQRGRQRDPSPLPAGQFVDASIEKAVDTDSREDAAHSRIARPLVDFYIVANDDVGNCCACG
ncbi:30S ribosomal protein S5 [Mycobacteroides abscessus subsp. abscessus]|nr:30S ribosomal protein S5 [Mycobacteroides abscessus subsp. abscessus]